MNLGSCTTLGDVIYDRRLRCLIYSRETFASNDDVEYDITRPCVIDRRLRERERASVYDYEDTRYIPAFCHSTSRLLSHAMPMTIPSHTQLADLYHVLPEIKAKIDIASGPVWFPKRKLLRTRETDGPFVPHATWHSVLATFDTGRVKAWTFLLNNIQSPQSIHGSLVSTDYVEGLIGFDLWPHIEDDGFQKEKSKQAKFWA